MVNGGEFVEVVGSGEKTTITILWAKLMGTLLGGAWLTVVAGWTFVIDAVTVVNVRLLRAIGGGYASIIRTVGVGGAQGYQVLWGGAFQAAIETSPLLAPLIMSLELVFVSGVLLWALRRWD